MVISLNQDLQYMSTPKKTQCPYLKEFSGVTTVVWKSIGISINLEIAAS
ncbi:MAG: hypothetical protein GDA48_13010 [Hormoscilla sp. GM102CHS1]|nr:hypothetical protein [Hormoscilla sp. SP12CHS1]MBC6473616.1 hypothetical protein [Hormoscilla sp. GM102CHS1]